MKTIILFLLSTSMYAQSWCFDSSEVVTIHGIMNQRDYLLSSVVKLDTLYNQTVKTCEELTQSQSQEIESLRKISLIKDQIIGSEKLAKAADQSKYEKILNEQENKAKREARKAKRKLRGFQIGAGSAALLIVALLLK